VALNENIILEAIGVSCSKANAPEPLAPVRGISVAIHERTLSLIAGGDQDGGSLLLRLLGLLETPDEGDVLVRGVGTRQLADDARADLRSRHFGFLFALPYLLPSFSVVENVAMPLFKISGVGAAEAQQRTESMLEYVGMMGHADSAVGRLTFPDQHRVSLARALVNQPDMLIVENVDAELSGADLFEFIALIQRASAEFGVGVALTAKDRELARFTDRVVELSGGAICRDSRAAVKGGGAAV